MDSGSGSAASPPGPAPGRRLDSWKEIADYLRRGVTTAQRWERDEGMPVHRHAHQQAGTVFAYAAEIDAWLATRSQLAQAEAAAWEPRTTAGAAGGAAGPHGGPVDDPAAWPLEPLGGAVPIDSPYYVRRLADDEFERAIAQQAGVVLVKGARQMGKSSLLARGLDQARRAGARVVLSDLQALGSEALASPTALFRALSRDAADQLGTAGPATYWSDEDSPNTNFSRHVQRSVLGALDGPLVWGLDEADRLLGCAFAADVFGLFRSWYNRRALDPSGPWQRLTLAIAYATEAHLFIADVNQSPFNVGVRITLEDFTPREVAWLAARHGRPLRDAEEGDRLMALVGGHPYLVQRVLHALAHGATLEQLARDAPKDSGPLGDHLRRMAFVIDARPALAGALREVLAGRGCPDQDSFFRLRSAGIVGGESAGTAAPRCGVYAAYLRSRLS